MASSNRVLYLSYDGLTDPLGQSQILPYLAGLTDYDITIVSFEKADRLDKDKGSMETFCASHRLTWVPLIYHKRPPVFSTLYDLWALRRLARKLHRTHSYQIVHCRSYITALVGLWMKRTYDVRFIFDMRGFWADERVEGGLWNLGNPVYRFVYSFFKKKEKQFIEEADAIISLTENAKQVIREWKLNDAIHVIPCCVDLDHFNPARISEKQKEARRKELGLGAQDFVVLYLGSLGTWYGVNDILDFFTQVKNIKPDARLLIVSPDRLSTNGYRYASDVILHSCGREDVPTYISLANAAVVFIKPVFSKKASSATKLAEVLAMGVPVVVNTGWGDIDRFENSLAGLYTVSSADDYASTIAKISQSADAQAIRQSAADLFSLTKGTSLYRRVYQDLT